MSLRVLWNNLVPWRRRRRYYFLSVLDRLRAEPEWDIRLDDWPGIFNVTPAVFDDFVAGRSVPRLFVQSLAIMAYKVPPPPRSYVFAPIITASCALVGPALYFLLRAVGVLR